MSRTKTGTFLVASKPIKADPTPPDPPVIKTTWSFQSKLPFVDPRPFSRPHTTGRTPPPPVPGPRRSDSHKRFRQT